MRCNSIILFLSLSALTLGYSYFFGETGYIQLTKLKKEASELQIIIGSIENANRKIQDKITSLIEDYEAVEHEARQKLGFIKENEVFFKEEFLETRESKTSD